MSGHHDRGLPVIVTVEGLPLRARVGVRELAALVDAAGGDGELTPEERRFLRRLRAIDALAPGLADQVLDALAVADEGGHEAFEAWLAEAAERRPQPRAPRDRLH